MNIKDTLLDEQELVSALRNLAREEERFFTPPDVEARVMLAFDRASTVGSSHRRGFSRPILQAAAIFVLVTIGGYWWTRSTVEPPSRQVQLAAPAVVTPWPSSEALAWLDLEPESLQIVRVRIASATLAAQGYALDDGDGDGLVELEVIIGDDGIARGARVIPAASVIY